MKKRLSVLVAGDDLTVSLAFHDVSASLFAGFAERVAAPFYRGDIALVVEVLMLQAIAERVCSVSHRMREK